MQKRKIVKSGNTSFTIALPIDWIRKNKLEKGSFIDLSENEMGDLVLSSEKDREVSENLIKTIKIDEKTIPVIYFEILDAYLKNFSTIILEGKSVGAKADKLTHQFSNFIGLDIIEQTSDALIVKNFSTLDNETSSRPLIRKMDLGIRAMIELLGTFFEKGFTKEDLLELKKLQDQNQRQYLFTRRIILKIIESPGLMKTYKTSYHQLSKDKVIAGIFNQLSKVFLSLGKAFFYLEHTKKDSKILKEVFDVIEKEYLLVMNSLRYKKYEHTLEHLHRYEGRHQRLNSFLKEPKNPLVLESISFSLFINDLLNQLAFEITE